MGQIKDRPMHKQVQILLKAQNTVYRLKNQAVAKRQTSPICNDKKEVIQKLVTRSQHTSHKALKFVNLVQLSKSSDSACFYDILQHYIYQAESMIGKPMMLMNKEEKIRALDYLDQKGVFKITKTSLLLCDAMQISKYTLYNYLEEARISRKSETNE